MQRKAVNTDRAGKPIGPYSQSIAAGNLLFLSGQIPLDPQTGDVVGEGVVDQTHQVLKNMSAILEEAGTDLPHVIKTTVFLQDMADFSEMNKVYAAYFTSEEPPARSTIEVARLPKDVRVEIECVAMIPGG